EAGGGGGGDHDPGDAEGVGLQRAERLAEEVEAAAWEGGVEALEDRLRVHAPGEEVRRDAVDAGRGVAEAEGAGVADDRDVDAEDGGGGQLVVVEADEVVDQLPGGGGGGVLEGDGADGGGAGGVVVDDDRPLRVEGQRGDALGL